MPRIGAGELLVRIHTCGICGTDLKKISTGSHSAPRVFGHEMAGVVVARGAGVTRFREGDRVMVFHHIPCGRVLLLPAQGVFAVPGVQAGGHDCGLWRTLRRRLFRVHPGDGLDRGPGRDPIPDGVSYEQASQHRTGEYGMEGDRDARRGTGRNCSGHRPGAHRADAGGAGPTCGSNVITSDLFPQRLTIGRALRIEPVDRRLPVEVVRRSGSGPRDAAPTR